MKMRLAVGVLAVLCTISMAATKASAFAGKTHVSGWVSDDKCGAKGDNASHADCAKKCVDNGAKIVVVSDKDKSIINVDNQDALKDHLGHHVRITGTMDNGTLHVDNVKMLGHARSKKKASSSM